jgi:hypothetical protein
MARIIVRVPNSAAGRIASEHFYSQNLTQLNCKHIAELGPYLGARGVINHTQAEKLKSTYHLLDTLDNDLFGTIAAILRFHNDPQSQTFPHGYVELIEPDRHLTLAAPNTAIGTGFTLKNTHSQYKTELDIAAAHLVTKGAGMRIAIIDSGIEPGTVTHQSFRDLLSTTTPAVPVDNLGHGTAMAAIIQDIAPDAEIHVVRIVDQSGDVTLWELIGALTAAVLECKAHIINLSLGFPNLNGHCPICGVYGHTRSKVLEDHLKMLQDVHRAIPVSAPPSPIFVAATGNDGDPSVCYPAAYQVSLAVGSRNTKYARSSFSNYGKTPDRFIILPGGDSTPDASGAPSESVGEGTDNGSTTYCLGTSAATAYASGLLALYWANKYNTKTPDEFIAAILSECDTVKIGSSYNQSEYGEGYLYYH